MTDDDLCEIAKTHSRGLSTIGEDYSDEERRFLVVMDRYKRVCRRPWPTWREVLAVVKYLGYRLEGEATREPGASNPDSGEIR